MLKTIYSEPYKQLVRRLADARKAAGLTQQFVADKLGRPQSFVAKYEQGERRLDVIELVVVCRLVGADVHELIEQVQAEVR
jgi:transcriptional regulator with XRE-family HTH domain